MTVTELHISGVRFIVHVRFACDSPHRSAPVMGLTDAMAGLKIRGWPLHLPAPTTPV